MKRLASLFKNLLLRDRVEQDLDEELRAFVDMAAQERREAGLPPGEARRAALIELGGMEQVRESVRDARAGALVDQLRQDLLYAIRTLGRNRSFTAVAIATLGLGIGANAAIFSIVDTVVFRPLPYEAPDRLVKIWGSESLEPIDNMSYPDFLDIREQNDVFDQVAGDDAADVTLWSESRRPIDGAQVTGEWLSTLGIRPILGRSFGAEDGQAGHDRVVLVTHSFWRHRLGADTHVVGRTLNAEDGAYTIVGVLPPNVLRYSGDFLKPLVASVYRQGRSDRDLDVFARLKPGVTIAQARARVDAIARRLEQQYPATNAGRRFSVAPLDKYYALTNTRANRSLVIMLGAVSLVLLIACANVANLLLARAVTRSRECVIRAALGAGRGRLIRQMLVETGVLFLLGGTLGIVLARWWVDALLALAVAGSYVPERMTAALDTRVIALTALVSVVTGMVFGLVPALHASKVSLSDGLRASSLSASGGASRRRATRLLIVFELAISIVLLVGSGLMIRSFGRLQASSAGIDPANLLETSSEGGRSFPEALAFWRSTLARVRQDPGVSFAAVSSRPPVHGARQQRFSIEGQPRAVEGRPPEAGDILVSDDYFRTMAIPILKGRAFSDKDSSASTPVVIISQTLARRFFANDDPIGKRLSLAERLPMSCCTAAGPVENVWREIVGVAADVRQGNLDEQPAMTVYRPYSQIVEHDMYLLLRARSSSDAARLTASLRSQLLALDSSKDWEDVRLMRDVISESGSMRVRRFVLILLGTFAFLALLLAAIGTYGVMAYSVADRTREIGIRVALGATRSGILADVLSESMKLTIAGLVIGTCAAQLLTRFIASLLFDVSATDLMTHVAVSFVLTGVALLASYVPARRATRVDPLVALRQE